MSNNFQVKHLENYVLSILLLLYIQLNLFYLVTNCPINHDVSEIMTQIVQEFALF